MITIDTDSIAGLWMSWWRTGYLTHWFGRLSKPHGQFVPLKPGLNVIYGRNGAGKSQLLGAIAAAANFQMSAYEGLIFQNPRRSDPRMEEGERVTASAPIWPSTSQAWMLLSKTETVDCCVGDRWGFDAARATAEQTATALAMLDEFRNSGYVMLARTPGKGEPGPRGESPDIMQAPMAIQCVPVLPPWVEAPVTREYAEAMRTSLHEFHTEMKSLEHLALDEDGEWDEDLQQSLNEKWDELAGEWLSRWEWNPLLCQRNFEYLQWSTWVDDFNPATDSSLNADGRSMLFLPSILEVALHASADEFEPMQVPNVLRLRREMELDDAIIESVSAGQMDGRIHKDEQFGPAAVAYTARLGRMLGFLPNAANMTVQQSVEYFGNFERRNVLKGTLVLATGTRASLGSAAERRWIQLARQALHGQRGQWLLIDEPEAGLHRSAETQLADCLRSPAWSSLGVLVVASHGPEMLEAGDNVIHIDEGVARPFRSDTKRDLQALGLKPADLLGAVRSILLVEGEHERIIFQEAVGEELRRLRCHVVVARGAKNMRDVFDSQMLFDYTDARLICLMDNMRAEELSDVWIQAKEIARTDVDGAGAHIRRVLPRHQSGENRFMGEFMTRALESGFSGRVAVHGMSKQDIVLYLDPKQFGLKKSWDDLLLEFDGSASFKTWAAQRHGADFSLERFRVASQALDHLPTDFGSLLMTIADQL